ncbi:MAG: hypothetical protein ABW019_05510 [Chitinophagaceae bacterium]
MIYLDGQQVDDIGGFSTRFQVTLSLIQGGTGWLTWALTDKGSPPVYVASENELLGLIQEGLHEDDYIRFNTFRACLEKIMTLSDADAQQLSVIQKTPNDNETNLQVLLQRNNMLSYGDINATSTLLTAIGAGRPDLFQALSFDDQLVLANFVKTYPVPASDTGNPVYTFASGIAATIPDFVALCLFYHQAQKQLPANLTPQVQNSKIQLMYAQLAPLVTPLLFTPSAGTIRTEAALQKAIPDTAKTCQFIGYPTIAAGAYNLVQNINTSNKTVKAIQPQIENYMAAVTKLVSSATPSGYNLSQDGTLASLRFENDQSVAITAVDNEGNLFLLPDTIISNNNN